MIPLTEAFFSVGTGKPRASGDDPTIMTPFWRDVHVNPARAGMIPAAFTTAPQQLSKPRASGDDPSRHSYLLVVDR